ncbi:major capsid protein [uncultured Mediterranean phage uvMED]|nr:major capsid protein [uncultured Mediterranean phage uvMED]BAR18567.1 major head protein [uncultured Mediterranean phage uvMED]BAR37973.1 major head protein [uncultured Mediterranean phage uvMED]
MAQPTNTFDTYDSVGEREDLSDVIYSISPTDTPFLSSAAKTKATAVLHEWQTDSLASAVTNNAVIEGDEATLDASTATTRLSNSTQIMDKTVVITGTQESVDKAGRASELAYQIAKRAKELKRDMEATITGNIAEVGGNSSTARKMGTLGSWVTTNDDLASDGASGAGAGNAAHTDGTQRAFTESQLKSVIKSVWNAGGDPSMVMVGPFNKQKLSGFTGNSTRFDAGADATLYTSVDVYASDFGQLQVVPNRFSRDRDAYVLDMEYWGIAFLRDFSMHELAKTGDSEKRQLLVEATLESRNEAASGLVADLTTS